MGSYSVVLWGRLISLVMSSRFTHVVACVRISFFLRLHDIPLFPPFGCCEECCHEHGWLYNYLFETLFSILLGICPDVELLERMVILF